MKTALGMLKTGPNCRGREAPPSVKYVFRRVRLRDAHHRYAADSTPAE